MKAELLREYVGQVLLELKRDEKFISLLKKIVKPQGPNHLGLAHDWIRAVEKRFGMRVRPNDVTRVKRFVTRYWPNALRTNNDSSDLARTQMFKALNSRFLARLV